LFADMAAVAHPQACFGASITRLGNNQFYAMRESRCASFDVNDCFADGPAVSNIVSKIED
jgi:hypothetical protein